MSRTMSGISSAGGGGDVTKAGNNTFTGTNTFEAVTDFDAAVNFKSTTAPTSLASLGGSNLFPTLPTSSEMMNVGANNLLYQPRLSYAFDIKNSPMTFTNHSTEQQRTIVTESVKAHASDSDFLIQASITFAYEFDNIPAQLYLQRKTSINTSFVQIAQSQAGVDIEPLPKNTTSAPAFTTGGCGYGFGSDEGMCNATIIFIDQFVPNLAREVEVTYRVLGCVLPMDANNTRDMFVNQPNGYASNIDHGLYASHLTIQELPVMLTE